MKKYNLIKKYRLPLIPFIIGMGCMIAYSIIGAEVAPDGTLLEPFFLIPIGYLFMASSILLALVVRIVSFYQNTKKNNK